MDQFTVFADSRLSGFCIYCGGSADSRDHLPSKALLDKPYPENFPIVESCTACNIGFSLDEEYLACFIDCVLVGSTDSDKLRSTTRRALERNQTLLRRIADSRVVTNSGTSFVPEIPPIERVITKFARGIAAYELSEPQFGSPSHVGFAPLRSLTSEAREAFESIPESEVAAAWPEIGSRAFQRIAFLFAGDSLQVVPDLWIDVQEGNFRYYARGGPEVNVRMVIREYLAAEVAWLD